MILNDPSLEHYRNKYFPEEQQRASLVAARRGSQPPQPPRPPKRPAAVLTPAKSCEETVAQIRARLDARSGVLAGRAGSQPPAGHERMTPIDVWKAPPPAPPTPPAPPNRETLPSTPLLRARIARRHLQKMRFKNQEARRGSTARWIKRSFG